MKAVVGVDDWKLPVFRRRLEAAGYTYEDAGEFTPGTTMLHVQTDNALALKAVLEEAQAECRKAGKP